jgi:hypothetical protein
LGCPLWINSAVRADVCDWSAHLPSAALKADVLCHQDCKIEQNERFRKELEGGSKLLLELITVRYPSAVEDTLDVSKFAQAIAEANRWIGKMR